MILDISPLLSGEKRKLDIDYMLTVSSDETDGGDRSIYGEPASLFVRFAASPWHFVQVSLKEDGTLCALHLTDRPVEETGRLAGALLGICGGHRRRPAGGGLRPDAAPV